MNETCTRQYDNTTSEGNFGESVGANLWRRYSRRRSHVAHLHRTPLSKSRSREWCKVDFPLDARGRHWCWCCCLRHQFQLMGCRWRWRSALGSLALFVLDEFREQRTWCGRGWCCDRPWVAGAEFLTLDMSVVHPQTGQREGHQAAEQGKQVPEECNKEGAGPGGVQNRYGKLTIVLAATVRRRFRP